jgi:hypothetical protein
MFARSQASWPEQVSRPVAPAFGTTSAPPVLTTTPPPRRSPVALSAHPIQLSDSIDAWLTCLTRLTAVPHTARAPQCDIMAEDGGVMTPQPAANPDAHATVNDFLDYTEYFPSDLARSTRLIGDLDSTSLDAQHLVHELAVKYGQLPTMPASERPDPTTLRKEIAIALQKAIYCRESTLAEAKRVYEVAERHFHRIKIIKTKLKALPEPPSRDPTPAPISPQAVKRATDRTPHLRLNLPIHRATSTVRPRGNQKSRVPLPDSTVRSPSSSDSESDVGLGTDAAMGRKRLKFDKDRTPKPSRSRARVPGSGTNVHSSVAGISTSNALARLSPPPPDARPGSRWAPWFKLTEYEMAALRKRMKKNAVWTPSEGMIIKELQKGNRGRDFYDKEKARCAATGEQFIDEEPVASSSRKSVASSAALEEAPIPDIPIVAPAGTTSSNVEQLPDAAQEDIEMAEASDVNSSTNPTRESQRRQAMRDAQELEEATRKLKQAADNIQELDIATPETRRRSTARPTTKRKRDTSPQATVATPVAATREQSLASQDSATKPPEPKRLRILPPLAPAPTPVPASIPTPTLTTPVAPSPVSNTPVPLPENAQSTSVQVPLAPAGPSTPIATKVQSKAASRHGTPMPPSPTVPTETEVPKSPIAPPVNVTAASTRSRRESVAPKAVSPAPTQTPNPQKATTPAPVATPLPTRPRSARGHVPTPKAQSEEPKLLELEQTTRELRRHSVFSQSALAGPTRVSARRKPPPKGDITTGEEGQKTVTNVKRAQGHKNKRKRKTDDEPAEEIDPDEPVYCICNDVSFGSMISCDNNVSFVFSLHLILN